MVDGDSTKDNAWFLILCVAPVLACGLEISQCYNDTCSGRCGILILQEPQDPHRCQCDDSCVVFGDCCLDFKARCSVNISKRSHTNGDLFIASITKAFQDYMVCRRVGNYIPIWMVAKCPEDFSEEDILKKCDSSSSNPILKLPVTIESLNLTFANIFCYYCHKISHLNNSTIVWNSSIVCNSKITVSRLSDVEYFLTNGICNLGILKPRSVTPRSCLPPTITQNCSSNYTTINGTDYGAIVEQCSSYQQVVEDELLNLYKNPHCALCSSLEYKMTNTTCQSPRTYSPHVSPSQGSFNIPYNLMFKFDVRGLRTNLGEVEVTAKLSSCPQSDEVYDLILKRCTKLYCPYGSKALNGECGAQNKSVPSISEPCTQAETLKFEINLKYPQNKLIDNLTTSPVGRFFPSSPGSCFLVMDNNSKISLPELKTDNTSIIFYAIFNTNCSIPGLMQTLHHQLQNSWVEDAVNVTIKSSGMITCRNFTKNSMIFSEFLAKESDDLVIKDFAVTFTPNESGHLQVIMCNGCLYHQRFLTCPSVAYFPHQYTMHNQSLRIIGTDDMIPPTKFQIYKNKAFVCRNYSGSFWANRLDDLMSKYPVLKIVVIGTSVLCCILTLFVYCLLPQLRNTPGKIVMSLTFSIALAQLISMILALPSAGVACYLIAMVGHSQWLSVFLWMSTMAIDVARTLNHNMTIPKSGTKSYAIYAALVWGLPILSVTAFALLEKMGYLSIGYGQGKICWIGSDKMLLYSLICPMAVCITVNIVCFVSILAALRPKIKVLGKTSYMERKQQLVKVFAKLTVLTGTTWIFLFLAVIFNDDVLWCMNILLNGTPGVYTFVCFVCNQRVFTMLKEKFFLKSRSPSIYFSSKQTV